MKKNLPVTQRELPLKETRILVSTTDLKGVITSANTDFIEISGFSTDELVGSSHNIVRHPDVPPAAFADLWKTLQSGKPWMGIVKNRCKNGDHYWVDAYVAPLYENGKVVSYQSVRVKPTRERVERAEKLYARLNRGGPLSSRWLPPLTLLQQIGLTFFGSMTIAFGIAANLGIADGFGILVGGSIGLMVFTLISYRILRPVSRLATRVKEHCDNTLIQAMYTGSSGDAAVLESAFVMLEGTLATVVKRIDQFAEQLHAMSTHSVDTASTTSDFATRQETEIEQIAAAVNQMRASIQEVSRSAAAAADAARAADEQAHQGQSEVNKTNDTMTALAGDVATAVNVIRELESSSNNIGSVLDVIRGVAEQTNLLALNAAIEAARAGEQGRGFAVVADEVRTLANRSHESTQEINTLIAQLQESAHASVAAMARGADQTKIVVEQAQKAGAALTAITQAVENIAALNQQIASAAEEQSNVSDVLNTDVQKLSAMTQEAAQTSRQTSAQSSDLHQITQKLDQLVRHVAARVIR